MFNSLLFMKCIRETIVDIVEENKDENINELKNYINNELSDYQVLHSLITGKLPDNKYNIFKEMELIDFCKETISESKVFDNMDKDGFTSFIENVNNPSLFGIDSRKNIMEFFLNEAKETRIFKTNKDFSPTEKEWLKQDRILRKMPRTDPNRDDQREKVATLRKKVGEENRDLLAAKRKEQEKSPESKQSSVQKTGVKDDVPPIKKPSGEKLGGAKVETSKKETEGGEFEDKLSWKASGQEASKKPDDKESKNPDDKESKKPSVEEPPKEKAKKADSFLSSIRDRITSVNPTHMKWATGGLAASVAAYIAYKVYQRYISKVGRQCKGDKECIKKVKIMALNKQMDELKKGLSGCSKTLNSDKCSNSLQKKIVKLQNKIQKEKSK